MIVLMRNLLRKLYKGTLYAIYKKYVISYRDRNKLPRCYYTYLRRIENVIASRDSNASFIFISDSHWGKNDRLSPLIVKHIINHTDVKRVFSGGDVITLSDKNKESMISLWNSFRKSFSFAEPYFYQIIGNHDDNSYQQINIKAIFSKENIISCQTIGNGIRFGSDYSFYVDDMPGKTRYICLDTGKQYLEEDDYKNVYSILKNTPPYWHIVVLSHIILEWIDSKYQCRAYIQRLIDIMDEYNTKNAAKVEMIVAGHVHNDFYTTTDGGIPIITVGSDAYGVACGKYKHTLMPYSEQCVTIFQLDYESRICFGTRIGRGEDFCYSLAEKKD